MAANYTSGTITIFQNVVDSYFWRLNSILIQKNTQHKKLNFHVTCSSVNAKKRLFKNNTLTMRKLHKNSMLLSSL